MVVRCALQTAGPTVRRRLAARNSAAVALGVPGVWAVADLDCYIDGLGMSSADERHSLGEGRI